MKPKNQLSNQESLRLTTFMLLGLICLLSSTFLRNWRDFASPVGWNISDYTRNRYEVSAVTIDSSHNPWLIAQKLFREGDDYELRHITENNERIWSLPPLTHIEVATIGVAKDSADNPWLVFGERLAHWNGTQWEFVPTPLNADLQDFGSPSLIIEDSIVWGVDYTTEGKRIIRLDVGQEPIQSREIVLPDELVAQGYAFEAIVSTRNDELLVAVNNDVQVAFYSLRDFEWQKITSFQKEETSTVRIRDVVTDSKDQIWVMLQPWISEKNIGKYDPKEDAWTWLDIQEQPELANRHFSYHSIAVDDLDRVWLVAYQSKLEEESAFPNQDSYSYEADAVGVFEQGPDNTLVEIRHYTTKNSHLETNLVSDIILGSDEKIWTWGEQLVWMDSSQRELPQPAPDWFVALTSHKVTIGLSILGLVIQLLALLQILISKQKLGLGKKS